MDANIYVNNYILSEFYLALSLYYFCDTMFTTYLTCQEGVNRREVFFSHELPSLMSFLAHCLRDRAT